MTFDHWPRELFDSLALRFGEPQTSKSCDGMSGAHTWRVSFREADIIVKCSDRGREAAFYRDVAPGLRDRGVRIPSLHAAARSGETEWLAIECLDPLDWPPSGRPPQGVLVNLARLHTATRKSSMPLDPVVRGAWLPEHTGAALGWFNARAVEALRARLAGMEAVAPRLLEPWCWISGDPSPPNWGLDGLGQPSLFDWELFRQGQPATDLAITIAGFPSIDQFREVAARYSEACASLHIECPWSLERLARDMAVAKVGTVVVLLAGQAAGRAKVPSNRMSLILRRFPGWVSELAADLA